MCAWCLPPSFACNSSILLFYLFRPNIIWPPSQCGAGRGKGKVLSLGAGVGRGKGFVASSLGGGASWNKKVVSPSVILCPVHFYPLRGHCMFFAWWTWSHWNPSRRWCLRPTPRAWCWSYGIVAPSSPSTPVTHTSRLVVWVSSISSYSTYLLTLIPSVGFHAWMVHSGTASPSSPESWPFSCNMEGYWVKLDFAINAKSDVCNIFGFESPLAPCFSQTSRFTWLRRARGNNIESACWRG